MYICRRRFAVVKFPDENNVSVVPTGWLVFNSSGISCKWPPSDIKKSVKNEVEPTGKWADFKAEPIHYSSKL